MVLQSSQRLPELQNSTRRDPTGFFNSTNYRVPIQKPSRIQFYIQKTKSSSIDTSYRGQRDLQSRKEILHIEGKEIFEYIQSSSSLLQDLPKAFQAFQLQDLPKALQIFQTFQLFMIFSLPGNPSCSSASSTSRVPPHSSILQLKCIFYIPIGFHRNSTEYQLDNTNFHSSKKGRCCDIGQIDIFSRIEFKQASILSSDNTNYKNDIQ